MDYHGLRCLRVFHPAQLVRGFQGFIRTGIKTKVLAFDTCMSIRLYSVRLLVHSMLLHSYVEMRCSSVPDPESAGIIPASAFAECQAGTCGNLQPQSAPRDVQQEQTRCRGPSSYSIKVFMSSIPRKYIIQSYILSPTVVVNASVADSFTARCVVQSATRHFHSSLITPT